MLHVNIWEHVGYWAKISKESQKNPAKSASHNLQKYLDLQDTYQVYVNMHRDEHVKDMYQGL